MAELILYYRTKSRSDGPLRGSMEPFCSMPSFALSPISRLPLMNIQI
jgi:hypothetical protein